MRRVKLNNTNYVNSNPQNMRQTGLQGASESRKEEKILKTNYIITSE